MYGCNDIPATQYYNDNILKNQHDIAKSLEVV